jgi:hypothetical protein
MSLVATTLVWWWCRCNAKEGYTVKVLLLLVVLVVATVRSQKGVVHGMLLQ